jgi:hypothetical protein
MRKQESGVLGRVAGILNGWSWPPSYFVWWAVLFFSLAPHLSAQTTSTIAQCKLQQIVAPQNGEAPTCSGWRENETSVSFAGI